MGTAFQRASNTAAPGVFSWVTGIASVALTALPLYLSRSAISSAVLNINLSLSDWEAGSLQAYNKLLWEGIRYGAAGGAITGISTALLLDQCTKISNRPDDYNFPRDVLLGIGVVLGVTAGGLAGAIYSHSLHQDFAFYRDEFISPYYSITKEI